MEELVPAFEESVFCDFEDFGSDILEVGIDSVLTDGFFKNLPFFSLVVGAKRVYSSIRERNLLRNTAIFINSLNRKAIPTEIVDEYRRKLQDKKQAEKELGRVMVLLDQYVDSLKSKLLAVFYGKYINHEYVWEKFCELSDILSRLFLEDISYLSRINDSDNSTATYHIYKIPYNLKRLEGIALIEIFGEYTRFGNQLLQSETMCAQLTETGKIFLAVINETGEGTGI